jgi:hypothetical protein
MKFSYKKKEDEKSIDITMDDGRRITFDADTRDIFSLTDDVFTPEEHSHLYEWVENFFYPLVDDDLEAIIANERAMYM